MEEIITRVKERGGVPTRTDIGELLASVGKPGEKEIEKKRAVVQLFGELGISSDNFQGHSIVTALDDYPEF